MNEGYPEYDEGRRGGFSSLPAPLRAALICAVPFMVVDFFNYFSAGGAIAFSLPILLLMYGGSGALAIRLGRTASKSDGFKTGAATGAYLWAISTLVNVIIGLILGTLSLGATLLLGLPYLCLCAPVQLIAGLLSGGLGGIIGSAFFGTSASEDTYYG